MPPKNERKVMVFDPEQSLPHGSVRSRTRGYERGPLGEAPFLC
jgi:hypothetical protein